MLSLTRRPLGTAGDLFSTTRNLSRLMDEVFGTWQSGDEPGSILTSAWLPACDIFENHDAVKIVAEVPGVNPEDVKLSLEGNVLTIRGEKKQEAEENTQRVHRYERSYGVFERTFTLPSTVDAEHIEANYRNGVLTVTLPKAEKARPREIPVKASR